MMGHSEKEKPGPMVPTSPPAESGHALETGRREAVLSVLEEDQLVSAKARTRFGRKVLSPGTRILLWGLRVYVLLMFVLITIQVLRALQGGAH